MLRPTRPRSGFTLIEISLVLVILSLLLSGLLAALAQSNRRANNLELQRKMDAIETALLNFRKLNNRLPCPADSTQLPTSATFAVEEATPGTCTGAVVYTGNSAQNNVSGDVPVRALNLPDDYMFDPWGGRFTYVASQAMTAASAFTTYTVNGTGNPGDIIVSDGASASNPLITGTNPSNARTIAAIALILSYGADGHGAYQISGFRKSAGSDNNAELQNCHCTTAGAASASTTASYVQATASSSASDPSNSFDDIVRYYLRSDLLSSADISR